MDLVLERDQPLHFVGVGGIGMSALAGILVERGFAVSGSDPKPSAVLSRLADRGVRVFQEQSSATIHSLLGHGSQPPLVVLSSAVRETNEEVAEARRQGLGLCHRSDVLAALINNQPSIAVAGSHGKTTTSTLIATLLEATGQDPTAVIGGIVPAFGSNGRQGSGRLLVAEADESDGSLVKFSPTLALLTNIELDHTDHYPNLQTLIDTLKRFSDGSGALLANRDCPILREHFQADAWWSIQDPDQADYTALALQERGDGTTAAYYERGEQIGTLEVPLPGRHNLSNVTAALAACRREGVPFADLRRAIGNLKAPGRRFDCRGLWQQRIVVDDYAHHPSEVAATLAMARLMVESGRSPLPSQPQRLLAVFQPHRYSRTAQFMSEFAEALALADTVIVAPLYSAGEAPIEGISSEALAAAVKAIAPSVPVRAAANLDQLTDQVAACSEPGDLVLAMGAGDVNSLWERLSTLSDPGRPAALVL
ncbi:MAG: UDP-N-acetylmuramate--L-alanine ligase [Cyanobacteriota bacterium]|nr:UDP-N-acetylmuramate--L-alanine ligase [Cyanobacteriota bacterium]